MRTDVPRKHLCDLRRTRVSPNDGSGKRIYGRPPELRSGSVPKQQCRNAAFPRLTMPRLAPSVQSDAYALGPSAVCKVRGPRIASGSAELHPQDSVHWPCLFGRYGHPLRCLLEHLPDCLWFRAVAQWCSNRARVYTAQ
jgi:hypothetical protein